MWSHITTALHESGESGENRRDRGDRREATRSDEKRKGEIVDDAHRVLSALRLGWSVAEMRGRNWPDGPPGEVIGMPDHVDHPLPLRIERGKTELRIEIQSVVAELARELRVDTAPDGTRFSTALGDKAKLLAHARAPKAADALRQALGILQQAPANQQDALAVLAAGPGHPAGCGGQAQAGPRRGAVLTRTRGHRATGTGQLRGRGSRESRP